MGKKQVLRKFRKGFTLMELVFALVIIGLGYAAISKLGTSSMSDSEVDNYVGKSMDAMISGITKYKFEYYQSNNKFSNLDELTFRTYARPLTIDDTTPGSEFLHPEGYTDIEFYIGHHGPAGQTDIRAFICMDASGMDWNPDTKRAAEQKFASVAVKSYPSVTVDGDIAAAYADVARAEGATAADPDDDGIICVTGIR